MFLVQFAMAFLSLSKSGFAIFRMNYFTGKTVYAQLADDLFKPCRPKASDVFLCGSSETHPVQLVSLSGRCPVLS